MKQVIVHIGLANAPNPAEFTAAVRRAIHGAGGAIVAYNQGKTWSEEWGFEEGVWYAVQEGDPDILREFVLDAARAHCQEAVAFTEGDVVVESTGVAA